MLKPSRSTGRKLGVGDAPCAIFPDGVHSAPPNERTSRQPARPPVSSAFRGSVGGSETRPSCIPEEPSPSTCLDDSERFHVPVILAERLDAEGSFLDELEENERDRVEDLLGAGQSGPEHLAT